MTRINTNVQSMRGLRNVQRANNLLNTSLSRLSTGLKINSGKDNPAGLIAGEALRLQVTTIEQSIKNNNRANNVISTADSALGEIGGLLNQIRGLVQEGLNSGALSQDEIQANQLQIDAALSAINRISANTTFAGDKLIDGSKAFTTQISSTDAPKLTDYQVNEALFGSSSTIPIVAKINTAATKGTLQYKGGDLTAAATLEVGGATGNQVLFLGGSSTVANVRDAINSVSDVTGVEATITSAATAATTTITQAANTGIVYTDARATAGSGVFSTSLAVEYVAGVGNNVATSVAVNTAGSVSTITVTLGTDGTGAVNATASNVITAITGSTAASALVTATNAGGSSGAGVLAAQTSTALTGGANAVLELTSANYGSAEFVDLNVLNGSFATTLSDGSTAADRDEGSDIVVSINGQTAQGNGLQASVKTASLDASLSFAAASNVANTTATVTVTGGGSLFQIGQEASAAGQIGMGLEAINTARLGGVNGKLYELGTGGGKSLLDVGPSVQGSDLVDIVEQALNRVSTLRGRLGAIQKNVIETNITTLGVAKESISDALSQIVDTDFAEETANMTKAQVLSQAGLSVLAIANQNPQQVLSLLR